MSNPNIARQIGHMAHRILDQINDGKKLATSDLVILCRMTETLSYEHRKALEDLDRLRSVFSPKLKPVELPTFLERR